MHHKDAISRSDRVLVAALAIVLATASAAVGSGMTSHPAAFYPRLISVIRPAAPELPKVPPEALPDVTANQLLSEHRCLTEALYYEARGEGRSGEQAVAEVIFRRLTMGRYGHSICAVIYEGGGRPGCQFSFTCDGSLLHPREASAWREAEQLAEQILTGAVRLGNATGSATNYHAVTVSPAWAPSLRRTTQIGNHIFYRNYPAGLGRPIGTLIPPARNDAILVADASAPAPDGSP